VQDAPAPVGDIERVTKKCAGGAPFQGNVGDLFWGGITGPRYFVDPKEKLIGIVFVQGPSIRAAYHAELRSMVYGAMNSSKDDK
jgi:CubicO group peptidase (beta-lactamase class C family)